MPVSSSGKRSRTVRSKRVQIGETSIIGDSWSVTASGRPKRASIGQPDYRLTRTRVPNGTTNYTKRLAADPEPDFSTTPKRGRGRPSKESLVAEEPTTTTKRGRGRPPNKAGKVEKSPTPPKATRGRPREIENLTTASLKRSRDDSPDAAEEAPRKRGRPANKTTETAAVTAPSTKGTKSGQKRGPKRKVRQPQTSSAAEVKGEESNDEAADNHEEKEDEVQDDNTTQYWLMKAEPNSRIERGHDVKFSIDDLAAATKPEAWDGVRNVVARNHMRSMRLNDLAFFYHSNCTRPGVVGIMRIVAEHAPDESAFDPKHPYYDPKSLRDKPKWDCVRVSYVKKFKNMVGLQELKGNSKLKNMSVVRMGRLSVSPVTAREWKIILDMAGENDVDDEVEVVADMNGGDREHEKEP